MAAAVADQLRRFARAWSRSEGRRTGRRVLVGGLAAFLACVVLHRLGPGLPWLARVEGHPLGAGIVVAGVYGVAWLAGRLAALDRRPRGRPLARHLDDRLGLADATDAALSPIACVDPTLAAVVDARATAGLVGADPAAIWRPAPGRARVPIALAALALALLLLPGVLGFGGRGAGRGTDVGAGRRPTPAERPGTALSPDDADRWLLAHGRVGFEVPDPAGAWSRWVARFATDAALPAAYAGDVFVRIDGGAPLGPVDRVEVPAELVGNAPAAFDAARATALADALTPGRHAARLVLRPSRGPWRVDLESPPVDVVVPPPEGGGGAGESPPPPPPAPAPSPPPPAPPPPPPPPPPSPAPPETAAPPPPDVAFHDEAVEPLAQDGPHVRKDAALVAVRDEHAGASPPRVVTVDEALADLDRVVERAVAREHVAPADRAWLRRYLEALKRAAGDR